MHRGDSKICRPTADRHSTCSVLNKTAPPVHGADGTQSIRTRFLRLFPCPDFLIVLLPGAHTNTANRRLCCSESRSELRSLLLPHDCENPAKHYQAAKNQTDSHCQDASRTGHCNFAYSALACLRMGMSGSAPFQSMRKSR